MTEYKLALFFHLLGAFSLIAGTIVAGVAFEAARRRRHPAEIALLLGLTRIGVVLVGIGTLLVLGFGLWLVELGHWGYGTGWIVAALVLLALTVVLGTAGGQRPKQARKLAVRLAMNRQKTYRNCAPCSTTAWLCGQLHLGAAPAGDHRPNGVQARLLIRPLAVRPAWDGRRKMGPRPDRSRRSLRRRCRIMRKIKLATGRRVTCTQR